MKTQWSIDARTATRAVASAMAFTIGLLMLLWVHPAHAQTIYQCRIAGHMVFQSSPCAPDAATPKAPVIARAVPEAAASAPKKKSLTDMLRERDAAAPARPTTFEWQRDGADVLRPRMGAM